MTSRNHPLHKIKKLLPILNYAAAWNTLDPTVVEPYLAEDVRYFSQFSLASHEGRETVMDFLRSQMRGMMEGNTPRVEVAITGYGPDAGDPCLIAFIPSDADEPSATIVLGIREFLLAKISVCAVPVPQAMYRTYIVPG